MISVRAWEWFLKNQIRIFISSLLVAYLLPCSAQLNQQSAPDSQTDLLNLTERFYGSDDMLISGSVYVPSSPLISHHPYFDREEWQEGIVFIDGRRFDAQQIRYDLPARKMILNAVLKEGATVKIALNAWKIDSLYLGDHLFINSNNLSLPESDTSFYELIHRNGFIFITGYHKEFIHKYTASSPYGLWSSQTASHFIYTDQWYPVTSKRSLLTWFPSGKDEIRKYMHVNRIRFRKATSDQLKPLLVRCGEYYQH
ncbi:MAG TPA: hypothetical protein PK711_07355 [Bacteroidales bacterium]|nr:hypothetical protein [Bacteroidales bacterium]HRZ20851.1 hypothetical protein [Bacteroidales bacterium]